MSDIHADIPPLEFDIDIEKWQQPSNSGPPRLQTVAKEEEIRQQVTDMLAAKIIRPSQQPYYSQVHLTPKPDGKWRFCIDFRSFNLCVNAMGWPLPNIQHMLHRIGSKKTRVYGKFDMTKGYYQILIAEIVRKYTAFITFMGVFEWMRVPMGLKCAASYFQAQIAMVVLAGLVYIVCEVYVDDILVHATSDEEFIISLKLIFERFRKYKLTINPDKTALGMSETEFVGHQIDDTGI